MLLLPESGALPLIQVTVLTAAGLVLWRLAAARLPRSLAWRITLAYFLSGAVLGPALENFHDLIWLPLLGFLVVAALLDRCLWRTLLFGSALLLVREDSGLLLFSLGFWALLRQPGARRLGAVLMLASFGWVLLSPVGFNPWSIRLYRIVFCRRSSATWCLMFWWDWLCVDHEGPVRLPCSKRSSPPGATLGICAAELALAVCPLVVCGHRAASQCPLLIALVSQGERPWRSPRYVLALVPGLYLGTCSGGRNISWVVPSLSVAGLARSAWGWC